MLRCSSKTSIDLKKGLSQAPTRLIIKPKAKRGESTLGHFNRDAVAPPEGWSFPPFAERPHLGPKVCSGADVLVLGFGRAPGVVQLEALVAVAGPAVHAALGGLLLLGGLADVAHDRDGGAGRLAVALHDALQGEVPEQHADAAFAQVDVVLAAGAGDGGDPRGHRPPAPPWGGDGTWWEDGREVIDRTDRRGATDFSVLAEAQV